MWVLNISDIQKFSFFQEIIKEATENDDPVASTIKQLKFEVNHIILHLTDPYANQGRIYILFSLFVGINMQ